MEKISIEFTPEEVIALQRIVEEAMNHAAYRWEWDIQARIDLKLTAAYQKPEMDRKTYDNYMNEALQLWKDTPNSISFMEQATKYELNFFYNVKEANSETTEKTDKG